MSDRSLKKMTVRFYIWDNIVWGSDDGGYVECTETQFKAAPGTILYERHSVFENGVSQIWLTKDPFI